MNRATKTNVTTVGVMLALSGIIGHGLFEVLQGYTPTEGLFIEAIGEAQRMWVHGGEGAFTIIPNYLITGILAISISLCIVIWSVGFVHQKHGSLMFLLLFIALFLVGGGVAQVAVFVPAWAVSTRINRPLTWWRRVLPESMRRVLARLWTWFLAAGVVLFAVGLVISITGFVPGLNDPDQILYLVGTRIHKPLNPEGSRLSGGLLRFLAALWPWVLAIYVAWILGQWVIGYFFNDWLLANGYLILVMVLGSLLLTVITTHARDRHEVAT